MAVPGRVTRALHYLSSCHKLTNKAHLPEECVLFSADVMSPTPGEPAKGSSIALTKVGCSRREVAAQSSSGPEAS